MLTTIQNACLSVSADTHGAELQAITTADGTDYLWNGDSAYWSYHAPTLFPIVGALRDGGASSAGGDIRLPRHGFCRTADFLLLSVNDTAVTYQLIADERTRVGYPYDFALCVTHSLSGMSVTTRYTVRNTGDKPLPFCIGGHPAFRVPLAAGERFEDYRVIFEQPETVDCTRLDENSGLVRSTDRRRFLSGGPDFRLSRALFRDDALLFDDLRSRHVRLVSDRSGHGVEMDFTGFDYFGIWSPTGNAPFVCLEPWTGTATLDCEDDVFEHKRGMTILESGQSFEVAYTITVF